MKKVRRYKHLVKIFSGLVFRLICKPVYKIFNQETKLKPIDKFLIFYFRQQLNFKKKPPYFKITSATPKFEGPGSQALNIIHAINVAHILKVPYVHTEFKALAHADRPMSEWAQQWEQHFNFSAMQKHHDSSDLDVINFAFILHHMKYLYGIADLRPTLQNTLPEFKKKYSENKPESIKSKDKIIVCIHVRRGDVTPEYVRMWTPVESILATITGLIQRLDFYGLDYELNLFSQGDTSDFDALDQFSINFHIDQDPIWCHAQLIDADILITARSTYSYTAALLSDGIIIDEPRNPNVWLQPLDHWVQKFSDGRFDQEKFDEQLRKRIRVGQKKFSINL